MALPQWGVSYCRLHGAGSSAVAMRDKGHGEDRPCRNGMGSPWAQHRQIRCHSCPAEARAELARILDSPEFVVPERARSFLRYLVEQTLAGRADRLKGYTIGTAVFERDTNFDSQADPVVRTEAGRLRRALERYYLMRVRPTLSCSRCQKAVTSPCSHAALRSEAKIAGG